MPPLVSVIVPAFNAGQTLGSTLASVLDQTFTDFEVVVVDDGSTDDTSEVSRRAGEPVRCIRTTNQGVSNARNRGVAESAGEYLAFLDADDLWLPEKLKRQVEALDAADQTIGGTYVGVITVDPQLNETRRAQANHFSDLCESLLLYSSVIPSSPSSLMVRREVDQHIGGFNPKFSQCADWDYLLRLSLATTLKPVPEHLVMHRAGDWNMSRNIDLLERDTFAVLDEFFADEEGNGYRSLEEQCYSNHWMILSGSYLHARDPWQSLRCLSRGLFIWPRNVVRPLGAPLRWGRRLADSLRPGGAPVPTTEAGSS